MSDPIKFPCYRCGACCRHVGLSPETDFLDRGDGVCRHFDNEAGLCTIYQSRPDICRVDRQYDVRYSQDYTWEEFVGLNLSACRLIETLDISGPEAIKNFTD